MAFIGQQGVAKYGVPNANLFYDLAFAAMILMYLTYTWGNSVHQQSKRKNPADYENDE